MASLMLYSILYLAERQEWKDLLALLKIR